MFKCKCGRMDEFEIEEYLIEDDESGHDADGYLIRNTTTGRVVGYYHDIDSATSSLEWRREDAALLQMWEFDDEA